MMRQMELMDFVKVAIECSVYVAPNSPGLSHAELHEVGKRIGYEHGEIDQAIGLALQSNNAAQPEDRICPGELFDSIWDQFLFKTDPDFRSLRAFDHVRKELRDVARQFGVGKGTMDRSALIERGVTGGLQRHDLEVAVTVSVYAQHLIEENGTITIKRGREEYPLPSDQLKSSNNGSFVKPRPLVQKLHSIVRDVIERRSDGRSGNAEPFDALAEALTTLGHGAFRAWWIQMVSELRRLDTTLNPVAATVLSAALVEGCLTFVVRHARALATGPMGSKTFTGSPTSWKIEDLVNSAASGSPRAILAPALKTRADMLVRSRQRIHAGRMLVEHPEGPADLRPEEARDAKQTAELVVRAVVDWVAAHPAPALDGSLPRAGE